jgi:hypothetical protein
VFEDPRDSNESGSFIEPGRYVLKVVKLEPMPPNPEHPDWKPSVRWTFNLAEYPSMAVKYGTDGQPYEWWQYSSVSMAKHPKAKTRPWVEAFLGRAVTDDDTGAALGDALLGAKAIALVGPAPGTGKDSIVSIQPYKAPAKAQASTGARPEMVAELEADLPPAERTGSLLTEEEEAGVAF